MGSARQINDGIHKRFIHRYTSLPEPEYAPFISQSFGKSLPKDNADILNGMMCIDMKVTLGKNFEIKQAVAAEGRQHMVEKANSRGYVCFPGAIQVNLQRNVSFTGLSRKNCRAAQALATVGAI
jgi:hypothetical protein